MKEKYTFLFSVFNVKSEFFSRIFGWKRVKKRNVQLLIYFVIAYFSSYHRTLLLLLHFGLVCVTLTLFHSRHIYCTMPCVFIFGIFIIVGAAGAVFIFVFAAAVFISCHFVVVLVLFGASSGFDIICKLYKLSLRKTAALCYYFPKKYCPA